jgi:ubiquinone/menaquinone biosynthesis C-methylase UbiE
LYNFIVEYLSFDSIASIYDGTRIYDEASFNAALDYIVERFQPSKYPKLFEPGIGTGRISIPLAERGYSVTGADISVEMLKILADKLARRNPPLPLTYMRHDITSLPFPNASFDIALAVHIFHLIRDWQKALSEVFRILKPGSPLILMYTGGGKEIPWIQDRYRELCTASGHPAEHIGVSDRNQLTEYLKSSGRTLEMVENRWQWTRKSSVREALDNIKQRHYGMTRLVPEGVHREVMEKLAPEVLEKYGELDILVEVPHQIRLIIVMA